MQIIRAEKSHVPEMIQLWEEFMDYHAGLDPYYATLDDRNVTFEKFLSENIDSENAQVLVALDQGKLVGHSISMIKKRAPVFAEETCGFISDLAVKSACRRKGIGEKILSKILEWFQSKNIRRIELSVVVENHAGYSFWKKQGFRDYMHELYLER